MNLLKTASDHYCYPRRRKVRILVITNLYPPLHGGTFDFRCQSLAECLGRSGHDVRVLTSNYGLQKEQRDAEVERRLRLNGEFGQPVVTSFSPLKELEIHNNSILRELLTAYQPNLVYVWSLKGLSKSLIFTLRTAKIPTVYAVSDDWLVTGIREDSWLRWWNRVKAPASVAVARKLLETTGQRDRINQLAPTRMMKGYERVPELFDEPDARRVEGPVSTGAFYFERIYFCSQALKAEAESCGFRVGHAEVIYPGIPTEKFFAEVRPASHTPRRFLVVSRLSANSGAATALEALRLAPQYQIQASLAIYGRGESDQMAQLRSFVIQHQLPVEFHTLANTDRDLAHVYRQYDGFIYCAEWDEPFAVTPLEAMASGLPVIAARSGGVRELVRSGENALVYTPGDALELVSRIQEMQIQPMLRVQMAETAQAEVMTRFSETAMIEQINTYMDATLELWQNN